MIALEDYKKALGTLVNELSEDEILKLRDNQDQMAEILFDMWFKQTPQNNQRNV